MEIEYTKEGVKFGDEFLTLQEITNNVNKAKIKEDGLVLLTMEWPWRRGFDGIKEQIVLPKDNVNRLKEILNGKEIYFGEIAGKHSEIFGTLEENEFTVDDNLDNINEFLSVYPNGHHYNHSFLETFEMQAEDGVYDDVDEELVKEFSKNYIIKIR